MKLALRMNIEHIRGSKSTPHWMVCLSQTALRDVSTYTRGGYTQILCSTFLVPFALSSLSWSSRQAATGSINCGGGYGTQHVAPKQAKSGPATAGRTLAQHLMLFNLPLAIQTLVSTFLWTAEPPLTDDLPPLTFELRHQHALTDTSRIVFSDVKPSAGFAQQNVYRVPRRRMKIPRPPSKESFAAARKMSMEQGMSMSLDWRDDEVDGPDVSTKDALLQFAHMAFNAYYPDNTTEWYDVSDRGWDKVRSSCIAPSVRTGVESDSDF